MSTNYNRYLDIHLCTIATAALEGQFRPATYSSLYFGKATKYFYEFNYDIRRQMRYRDSKAEGFTFNNKNTGNCKILDDVELTDATDQWLTLTSTLDTTGGGSRVAYSINDQLKQLRYVGCMVSIEKLQTNDVYPQLRALMLWISDPSTQNKLRINCHGSGKRAGGMTMGTAELSPEDLVSALVRHGLTRPSSRTASAAAAIELAQNARWKLDKEKDSCENCNKKFGVFTLKHHCRRCGGLFCDKCSSKKATLKVALTGEERGKVIQQTATASNVKNARVCDPCYSIAASPVIRAVAEDSVLTELFGESVAAAAGQAGRTDYGLTTITLALCMGARADDQYSPERNPTAVGAQPPTTFVPDSLASRLLTALRDPNRSLKGIKVAASNQVVEGSDTGITVTSEVTYPNPNNGIKTVPNVFPAYVWGNDPKVKADVAKKFLPFDLNITLSPCGRAIYFSSWQGIQRTVNFYNDIYKRWDFDSWQRADYSLPPLPGVTGVKNTWRLTAPPRVQSIKLTLGAKDKNRIELTVRNTGDIEMFKHYKSYEVS